MSNYSRALEFCLENNVILDESLLKNLKDKFDNFNNDYIKKNGIRSTRYILTDKTDMPKELNYKNDTSYHDKLAANEEAAVNKLIESFPEKNGTHIIPTKDRDKNYNLFEYDYYETQSYKSPLFWIAELKGKKTYSLDDIIGKGSSYRAKLVNFEYSDTKHFSHNLDFSNTTDRNKMKKLMKSAIEYIKTKYKSQINNKVKEIYKKIYKNDAEKFLQKDYGTSGNYTSCLVAKYYDDNGDQYSEGSMSFIIIDGQDESVQLMDFVISKLHEYFKSQNIDFIIDIYGDGDEGIVTIS